MEISHSNSPFPEEPTYKAEFKKSADLFEKSFHQMQHSTFDAQRDQYVKVMKESLSVMQESANGMLNKHLACLKDQLSNDLSSYLENPSGESEKKILNDIEQIKNNE